MDCVLIIDGNSLMNRAFFALPPLTTKEGIQTNAVLGFLNMMNRLIDDYQPTHLSVAFDVSKKTFRNNMYSDYKGTRKGMMPELRSQMPIIKEILSAMNIHQMGIEGFEADDLIGTVAKHFSSKNVTVKVATGDKDALQLTDDNIQIVYAKKGGFLPYTKEMIKEEFGICPIQIIDYKGLAGDKSDNIPGIPGFGPKTTKTLLQEYSSVENIIENAENITKKRWKELIIEHSEQALLSKKLATIMIDVPVEFEDEEFKFIEPDYNALRSLLIKYEFTRLLDRYIKEQKEEEKIEYTILDDPSDLIERIKKEKLIGVDIISDKDNILMDKIHAITILLDKIYYVPINDLNMQLFKDIFEDEEIIKVSYKLKQQLLKLYPYHIEPRGFTFDIFIASYLLNPGLSSYNLHDIYLKEGFMTIPSTEEFLGKNKKKVLFSSKSHEEIAEYSAMRISKYLEIKDKYLNQLEKENLFDLFNEVEMPLVEILSELEYNGMNVDVEKLDELDKKLSDKIEILEKDIYDLSEQEFNINSPKQLGVVLFEELKLPVIKKTKTGYSTAHDILEKLKYEHPVVEKIIDYRTYTKLKSTYIDGLRKLINPVSHKIHSSFNQTVVVTGRLSSTDPNMQNIPMRLEEGREIRKIFTAKKDYILIGADYSQIELRVLAHMSKDETLIKAFKEDVDIHSLTAASVFHVEIEDITTLQRSRAKEVNFGIMYGMSDYGLSENLHISRKEAKEYIENYFKRYSSVKEFMDGLIEGCKEKGYVETILHRRRYVPDIKSSNFNVRAAAMRTIMNTPIQGSAADIIKIAMIDVNRELKKRKLKSKMVLQVHDELLIETHKDEIDIVKDILKTNMENAIELLVPLKVSMNEGSNWYEAK